MLSEGLSRPVLLVIALSLGVLHCLVHGHAEVSELSQELAARVVFRGRRLKVLDANHLLQCPRQCGLLWSPGVAIWGGIVYVINTN